MLARTWRPSWRSSEAVKVRRNTVEHVRVRGPVVPATRHVEARRQPTTSPVSDACPSSGGSETRSEHKAPRGRQQRWCCSVNAIEFWESTPTLHPTRGVRVDHFSYPTRTRSRFAYPTRAEGEKEKGKKGIEEGKGRGGVCDPNVNLEWCPCL